MNIVTIFIQNSKNELLIQKRSKEKNGKYGITSGHIEKNESNMQGAVREVKEELGLDIKNEELKLFFNTEINTNTYNLYYLKKDINLENLTLQKDEVEKVKWCTNSEIDNFIKRGEFYEVQIEALDLFKKYINGGINYGDYSTVGHEQ